MIDAPLALAFAAGTVAAFNPCGFALLPVYVSYYLSDPAGTTDRPMQRAVTVALSVTAGFALVFGVSGALIVSVSSAIARWAPWVGIVIGFALIPLGVSLARGNEIKLRVPGLRRSRPGTGPLAMFVFGVGYALASLACTIPPFLVLVSTTFGRASFLSGMLGYAAYTVGMALVLVTVTLAVALARTSVLDRMRRVLAHVTRVSGWLVLMSAVYVVYYGWFQLRVLAGEPVIAAPAELVTAASEWASTRVTALGAWGVWLLAIAAMVGGLATERRRRSEARVVGEGASR